MTGIKGLGGTPIPKLSLSTPPEFVHRFSSIVHLTDTGRNEAGVDLVLIPTSIPGFLKTGLAKISTHSTTWQFKTTKLIQRPIKSLYLMLGSRLVVPRSIPMSPNLNMTQILEHFFSKLTSRSFKPMSFQSRNF